MSIPTPDIPQPSQAEVTTAEVATRGVELQPQYEQATKMGRLFLVTANERSDKRLTSFIDHQRLAREDIQAVGKKAVETLSQDDIIEAARGSLGIALEIATQINEFKPSANTGVREDMESLQDLIKAIRIGGSVNQELIKSHPNMVIAEMRKVIARRQRVSPDQVKFTEKELIDLADQQFRNAFGRLSKAAEALVGYRSR